MSRRTSTANAAPSPLRAKRSRRAHNACETAKIVSLGADSPRRRALGLTKLNLTWTVRRDQTEYSKDEWYRTQVDPELLGSLPSFHRSAKVPDTIRPLRECNPELFNELITNRPRFSDPLVKTFWSHLERTWEDAVLGYRWRWPDSSPPYRMAVTESEIKGIIAQCKWSAALIATEAAGHWYRELLSANERFWAHVGIAVEPWR